MKHYFVLQWPNHSLVRISTWAFVCYRTINKYKKTRKDTKHSSAENFTHYHKFSTIFKNHTHKYTQISMWIQAPYLQNSDTVSPSGQMGTWMPALHQASKSPQQRTPHENQNVQSAPVSSPPLTAKSHRSCRHTYTLWQWMSWTTDYSWNEPQQTRWQTYLSVNMMILSALSLCLSSSFLNRLILWPPPAWLCTSPPSHFSPRPNTWKEPHSCTYSLHARPHRYGKTSAKQNETTCLNWS